MITLFQKAVKLVTLVKKSALNSGPVFQAKSNHIEVIKTSSALFLKTPGVYSNVLRVKEFSDGVEFTNIDSRYWDDLRQVFHSSSFADKNYRGIAISFCEKYRNHDDYKPAIKALLPQILPAIMTSYLA